MKRPRRAVPIEKQVMNSIYSVECPHCKTELTGGVGKDIDRMFCWCCKEIIILDWKVFEKNEEK